MAVAAARLPGPPPGPPQRSNSSTISLDGRVNGSNSNSNSNSNTTTTTTMLTESADRMATTGGSSSSSKMYTNGLSDAPLQLSYQQQQQQQQQQVLINPIAAYSQQLADKQLHIARVNSEGVVHWRRKEVSSDTVIASCDGDGGIGDAVIAESSRRRLLPGKDFFKDGLLSKLKVSSDTALEGGMLDTELSLKERKEIEQKLAVNGHTVFLPPARSDDPPSSSQPPAHRQDDDHRRDPQQQSDHLPNGNGDTSQSTRPSLLSASSHQSTTSDANTFSSSTTSTYGTPLAQIPPTIPSSSASVVDDNVEQPKQQPSSVAPATSPLTTTAGLSNGTLERGNKDDVSQPPSQGAEDLTQVASAPEPPLLFVKTSPTISRQQQDKKVPPPLSSLQQLPQAHIIPPTPPTASTSSSFTTPQASTSAAAAAAAAAAATASSTSPKAPFPQHRQQQYVEQGPSSAPPDSPPRLAHHLQGQQSQQARAATDPISLPAAGSGATPVPRSPVTPSTSSATRTSYLSPDSIKRSPPSHRRSHSYQSTPLNPRASTSTTGSAISPASQSPSHPNVPLATAPLPLPTPSGSGSGSGSFPARRSSLLPPLTTSSALSIGADVASLRKLSLSPRRALSFRGGGVAGTTLPGHGPIYDEPMSLEEQAEQQRQADQLDETIARQAEQMRKERLSKRIESQRAHDKALAALREEEDYRRERGEDTGASALLQGSPPGKDNPLVKERERGDTTSTLGAHSQQQHQHQQQPSPASPASVHKQLWAASPVAGEKAVLRATSPSEVAAAQHLAPKEKQELQNEPERVLVGNLIGEDHVNYVLMYNMLTGIRIGVSRCEAKIQRPLTSEDYKAQHKFSFDIVGNELTPSARYDFKFKDYAPWVFRELRAHFHLDPADYLLSLTSKYILSELGSPGKSGSFFYFSRDYRFIIKTISHTEHKFLRKILKEYHTHVLDNPNTLISRFYGLHRVKLPHGRKIHFVIMNNLFPPHRDIHETFDLKGSSIGREYPEEKAAVKPRATLKDLNWIRRQREIHFGPTKRKIFEDQLKADVALLQRLKIMDYSLLIGIHDMGKGNSENLRDGMLTVFQPEGGQGGKLRRRPTHRGDLERDYNAAELRKAVQRADPQVISNQPHQLAYKEQAERRQFFFYHDEGGIKATDDNDNNETRIYYLGVIDILTPYNWKKRIEHFWRSMQYDKHRISAVPPKEYGDRFLGFLMSAVRGGDQSKRPKME